MRKKVESKSFKLTMPGIKRIISVKVNKEELAVTQYSTGGGAVILNTAPAQGTDIVEITYSSWAGSTRDRILGCRYAMSYGGDNDTRVFLWGNSEYPSVRFCSALADGQPSICYFTEKGNTSIGDGEEIRDIIRHYDRQLIFTAHSAYYSFIEYKTDGLGRVFASFPVYTLSGNKGNIARSQAVLIDNAPCTLSEEGLIRWASTNVRDERNAVCFSDRIKASLTKENLENAIMFDRATAGELFVSVGDRCYIYNYRLDLFYYYEGIPATCYCENGDGALYFGTSDGRICRAGGTSDEGRAIEAVWESGMMSLGDSIHLKNAYTLTLGLAPDSNAGAKVSWVTDRASSKSFGRSIVGAECAANTLDFSHFSFDSLCFYSVCGAYMSTIRMCARRFGNIRLILTNDFADSRMSVLSLCFTGEVCEKRI